MTRSQISILVLLTLGTTLLALWLRSLEPTWFNVFGATGTTITIVYFVIVLFDKFGWHLKIFRNWLVHRPDLRGSWKATLHSEWENPDTGDRIEPIEAYVVIRQTLFGLVMRLYTSKSKSVSLTYSIKEEPDGLFELSLVYRNTPKIEYQGVESEMHHGSLLVDVNSDVPKRLVGHYWTDRRTRGTIELDWCSRDHYESFEDAQNTIET